jgi:hypothetical protein
MPSVFRGSDNFDTAGINALRAWVNFNGTTSPGTIRASGNVSSVTRNGTGDYTVNFTTAMLDANYAPNISVSRDGASQGNAHNMSAHESLLAGAYRFVTYGYGTFSFGDHQIVTVSIFR